jgi:CHAT domain-containing protein/Tfp pilus assembly protein PilF
VSRRLSVCSWVLVFGLALIQPAITPASADPVSTFIHHADSLAQAGGDDLLTPYVVKHSVLVGAVVSRLLDEGIDAGEEGNKAGETENLDLAERIARLHKTHSGSDAPLQLVETFKGWSPEQRTIRKRAKTLEEQAFAARDAGEHDKSLQLFLQAMDLFEKVDDRYSQAVTWGSLGVVHWYRGDMDAVKENYQKALTARRAIENRILEGKTLCGLGASNFMTGYYDTAIDYFEQAIGVCRKTGDLTWLGTSLNYLGSTYYQIGDLIKARDAFEEALPVLEQSGDQAKMMEMLINIANFYTEMGRMKGANAAYREAIDIAITVNQPQNEAASRMNLADNLRLEGRFREAFEQLETSEKLLENLNEPIKKVRFYLKQTEDLSDPFYRIEALISLGYLYKELGAYEQGLSVVENAKALAEESENARLVRDAIALAAEMQFGLARYEEAMQLFQDALDRDRQAGIETYILEDKVRIARIHAVTGNMSEARSVFRESIPISRASGLDLERTLHLNIGHTYEDENPDSAIYYYERALEVVEQRRAALGGAGTRTGFLSGQRRYFYEEVARYYASLDERGESGEGSERAFHTIERAKARGLLDLLEAAALKEIDPVEEALLDSLHQIAGDSLAEKRDKQRLERRYLERREERVAKSLGPLDSRDAIVSMQEVQKALPKGTLLLEYALGDTTSLLWIIDRKSHELAELPNRRSIRAEVERLRDAIEQPGTGDEALRKTAQSLYETLVLPAEQRIKKAKRIVIVPDGVLFELPFEVLISKENGENAEWKDVAFLARSTATVYAPSASIYVKLLEPKKRKKYPLELLAVGDPDFGMHGNATDSDGNALASLPYTRSEIEAISSRLKDKEKTVLLGSEASEARLKQNLRKETPRILHLATHGLVDPVEPAASSVVLCPDPDGVEDGYLHTLEILELPIDVGLVVVSACESARGRVGRGEGVVGLSRAFVASGADGVVASLWAVSDKSTSELMKHFYKSMLDKKRPASTALREARLALMDDPAYAHPFYWSPFVVIGTDKSPW